MDLEYELRPEYRDLPLSELLELAITCFQGVGDSQQELLQEHFQVDTLQDLACLPAFEAALSMQALLAQSAEHRSANVRALIEDKRLNISVREGMMDKSLGELLAGPLQNLDSTTPAQGFALYEAFRTTTLEQLAHNEVMLESRLILYLVQHGETRLPEKEENKALLSRLIAPLQQVRAGLDQQGNGGPPADWDELPALGTRVRSDEELTVVRQMRNRFDGIRNRAQDRARAMTGVETEREETVSSVRASLIRDHTRAAEEKRHHLVTVNSRREAALAHIRERVSQRRLERRQSLPHKPSMLKPVVLPTAPPELHADADHDAKTTLRKGAIVPQVLVGMAALLVIIVLSFIIFSERRAMSPPPELKPTELPSFQSGAGDAASGAGASGAGAGAAAASATGAGAGAADASSGTGAAASEQDASPSTSSARTTPTGSGRPHQVREGDTLWRLSEEYYQTPYQWERIYQANEGRISNPNLIYPTQEITIPRPDASR